MKPPVLVTAFGTTDKAFDTYEYMDKLFRQSFNDISIFWAYSSRFVRVKRNKENGQNIKDPVQVLKELQNDGHKWAVVQSLHIISGHEFQRLVTEALKLDIRISFGLPLLTSVHDYQETASAMESLIPASKDEAIVFVGHGTDHPAWTSYPVFEEFLRKEYGPRVFTGVLEGYPGIDETIEKVEAHGFKKVNIIPFMLVAGMHFNKELTKNDDSWQKRFEKRGIKVNVVNQGIGRIEKINDIFSRHISEAINAIP